MSPRKIHLVGSVPLANAETVFRTVGAALGERLSRLPDGETGARQDWITWLEPVFADNPGFEPSGEIFQVHEAAAAWPRYRLKPGVTAEDVEFEDLLYADIALRSHQIFSRLRQAGEIPAGARFQVDLAPAHSVLWLFLVESLHGAIDPIYNRALRREIDKIAAAIAHRDLAIQLDVASAVFARLERAQGGVYGTTKDEMASRFTAILAGLCDTVPADVELLLHFCYGDAQHRHVVEPTDMSDMVEMANRLSQAVSRPIQLIHMPVPRDRWDGAYFRPLSGLALKPETELCLGLVHHTDGVEGTGRRLAMAEKYVEDFSIATECGFGRRAPETIPELLGIHAAVADGA